MTIIVVDQYGVTTDTWASIGEGGRSPVMRDGFRKLFPANIVVDDKSKTTYTPHGVIAFTGDAGDFLDWMLSITTESLEVKFSTLVKRAAETKGTFRLIIPCYEGVIRITTRDKKVLVEEMPFDPEKDVFVFGGAVHVPLARSHLSWFEHIIHAHEKKTIESLEVERFIYAEGKVIKDRVLSKEEAEEQRKKRRRPWASIAKLNRNKKKPK